MSEESVELVRRSDGAFLAANLYDGMRPEDLVLVEREWGPVRSVLMQELLHARVDRTEWPQSLHWDWSKKAPELKLLESTGFGIVCEKRWQGVMLTKSASHLTRMKEDKGKPLVYVDYLEIAPWNWNIKALGREGEFRSVGSLLFWRAVKQSIEEGFHGRVGLHSLPQSEWFYEEHLGMTGLGPDTSKQNLLYYELSGNEAERLLDEGGER